MEILRCQKCEEYTLEQTHCGLPTIPPRPPRYSPDDRYAAMKREVKREQREAEGVL